MERSYEQGSDLELMAQAAKNLSEAGSEEYWAALLESVPELKEDQGQLRGLNHHKQDSDNPREE